MYHLKSLLLSILHLNPKCKTQLAQERLHLAYNDIFIAKKKQQQLSRNGPVEEPFSEKECRYI